MFARRICFDPCRMAAKRLRQIRRLYARLSAWISTGHAEIYAKVVFCATAISAITAVFVVVDVLELLFTRFYNWECLLSWVIQRVIEVGSSCESLAANVNKAHGHMWTGWGTVAVDFPSSLRVPVP